MVFFALVKTGLTRQLSPSSPSSFCSAALPNAAAPRGTGRRSPSRKLAGCVGEEGAGRRRREEGRAGAMPARCCLAGPPACAAAVLAPGPGLSRRGGARGRRRGAPTWRARGGEEGPLPPARRTSESGRGRWEGRRRSPPRRAIASARAGRRRSPPRHGHRGGARGRVHGAALVPPWPPPSSFSSSAGDPRYRRRLDSRAPPGTARARLVDGKEEGGEGES